jgi:S-adenosylmethionine-diacylglycerol 3-amino-3-carboxypropyl transferase
VSYADGQINRNSALVSEIKFAVVREDPFTEIRLMQETGGQSLLLVASGGCTALSVKQVLPDVEVVCYDFNPAQIAHVQRKNAELVNTDRRVFNVHDADPSGLNQCGAFERLFRILRIAVIEWVAPLAELEAFFAESSASIRADRIARWLASAYWPAVFASVFHDPLLHALFGRDATQHAPAGSYPAYFQGVIEAGLQREDANRNPFLQHILLGYYLPEDAPVYLRANTPLDIALRFGGIPDMPDLGRFDVVHLSNIFDWCDATIVASWAQHLAQLHSGARVIVRQLNNCRDMAAFWGSDFILEPSLSDNLAAADRSLFYNRIQVWRRR